MPFLVELGVMTPTARCARSGTTSSARSTASSSSSPTSLPALPPDGPLRVVDFGSGKSYLTFALHHLLARACTAATVEIVGLDLKEDVVEHCATLADRLGAVGLALPGRRHRRRRRRRRAPTSSSASTPATRRPTTRSRGPCAGRRTRSSPCRAASTSCPGQIENATLAPLLRHGLLRERFAADVTDAVRAQLLGLVGLRRAARRVRRARAHAEERAHPCASGDPDASTDRLAREYLELKRALGLDPALERSLADELAPVLAWLSRRSPERPFCAEVSAAARRAARRAPRAGSSTGCSSSTPATGRTTRSTRPSSPAACARTWRRSSQRLPHSRLFLVRQPGRARRERVRLFYGSTPERGGRFWHADARPASRPARARSCRDAARRVRAARRAARAPAPARLHPRQARPLLRP